MCVCVCVLYLLQTKVLEVLVERDETLLGHEVFAIVHGLPRYLTHRVDLKEPVELLARLCAPSPFLPIKYATDALNAGGESCVPLLEALDLLVVACPRSLLDYSEHPGLVRLVSQYALSEDASVSTPARAVLAHLYAAGVGEQLFAYVPSDKAAAIRGIVAVSNALTPSEPALLEFTEEGLEEAGCAIEQARKAKDLGRLAREAAALQRLLASATTTSGSTQPPPPPHVYEAEGLLTALARVVPIMLRDPQIEVPMVGAVCALNACLKRGYIDVQGLSQGCVDMLVHALLLRRNSELHRTLVVLFKLGNPFRIAVALVRLAQNSIISGGGGGGGTEALELLDEAALLCAKATDPERDGLRSLLSTLNDALTDSMMHEQPPYEVAKACVRTLKTLHSGPNRALTEKLCRNVDMGSATLTTFLYDSFDNDDDTAAAADEEGNCMNNNNSNRNNNNSVRNSNDDDSNEIERPHTPLGQSH